MRLSSYGNDLAGLMFFEGRRSDEPAVPQPSQLVAPSSELPVPVQDWKFGEHVRVVMQGSTHSLQDDCKRSALKFSRFAQCKDGSVGMLLFCPMFKEIAALKDYSVIPSEVVHQQANHACYLVPAAMVFKALE